VPFTPGRVDASAAQTDAASFAPLEPVADGFRNFYKPGGERSPAVMLVDRADLLGLTVPEMTVLVGGMRALNANTGGSANGVLTSRPGVLTNDFFVNLLDMSTQWSRSAQSEGLYEGRDRESGALKWTATPVDLVFGSNSELRAVSEVYASADGRDEFLSDFVDAWVSVMNRDLQ
ncbi:MAG: catalase-peroxidase, partial [Brevundimonas sp.]|nr:catalase-peroxidase [Brevundimonas sp.]